jgi:hypothetical protein
MEISQSLTNLTDGDVNRLLNLARKKILAKNSTLPMPEEELLSLSELDDENKANFQRLLLGIILTQENDISNFLKKEMEFMLAEGANRSVSQTVIDVIAVAGVLLPLIQTKVKIRKDKKTGWTFEVAWDSESTNTILISLLKPIEMLASKVKKLSVGNLTIGADSEEEDSEKKA